MPGVIVDIGTGDGSFALELARSNPDRYIIGIDPNHQALAKVSLKSQPGNNKNKYDNLLYVLARIEDLPHELDGIVNQVFINFPWASLSHALFRPDPAAWRNIDRICQPGALIEIVFSYDPAHDSTLGLPLIDDSFVSQRVAPKLRELGFEIKSFVSIAQSDLKHYPSSWAKKLAHGRARQFYHLQVQKASY